MRKFIFSAPIETKNEMRRHCPKQDAIIGGLKIDWENERLILWIETKKEQEERHNKELRKLNFIERLESLWSTPLHFLEGIRSHYKICCIFYFIKISLFWNRPSFFDSYIKKKEYNVGHVLCDKCYSNLKS